MTRAQIVVPENKQEVPFDKAIELYYQGERILATISDAIGIYGAHVFNQQWDNLDRECYSFCEYKHKGTWFLLKED